MTADAGFSFESIRHLPIRPAFGTMEGVIQGVLSRKCKTLAPDGLGTVPPRHLAFMHSPARATQIWQRVLDILRNPVQRFTLEDGARVFHVMRGVVLRKSEGCFEPYLWMPKHLDSHRLEYANPGSFMLEGLPRGWNWLERIVEQAGIELRLELGFMGIAASDSQLQSYLLWLGHALRRSVSRHADLRQVRHRVARGLELDAKAVQRIRCCVPNAYGIHASTLHDYNNAVRVGWDLDQVEKDAPHLAPLFVALGPFDAYAQHLEPVQRLKNWLLQRGFTPRDWRFIFACNRRLLRPMYEFCKCQDLASETVDYLRVLCASELPAQPPEGLMYSVLSAWGHIEYRKNGLANQLRGRKLFVHVMQLAVQKYGKGGYPEFDAQLQMILRWAAAEGFDPGKDQRRAGWGWLLRQATAHHEEVQASQRLATRSWNVPVYELQVGDYQLRFLGTGFELWTEAREMRHCVDTYDDICAESSARFASVFLKGKRLATAYFAWSSDTLELVEIKGRANRPVDEKLARLLNVLHVPAAKAVTRRLPPQVEVVKRQDFTLAGQAARLDALTERPSVRTTTKEKTTMKTILTNTGGYLREVEVRPVEAVPDTFHISFHSRLLSAKNPQHSQKNFEITLDREGLVDLKAAVEKILAHDVASSATR